MDIRTSWPFRLPLIPFPPRSLSIANKNKPYMHCHPKNSGVVLIGNWKMLYHAMAIHAATASGKSSPSMRATFPFA
jgi:hypothetical protein